VAGVPGLTPRMASAAMALVTAVTEPKHMFVAFTTQLSGLDISPRWRLDQVVKAIDHLPFGGTDCSQPMIWAKQQKLEVDTFVVYTDSETWAGQQHPAQALADYRASQGLAARSVVVGLVSNGFTIADPNDAGMLDVVGFDAAAPSVIADFARK
jgi:60 kDa SS-A/Ro ribonucleoprotein